MSDAVAVVVTASPPVFVVVTQDTASVVESISQGPPGPPGSGSLAVTSGQTLSGHRIVAANSAGLASYADKDTPATWQHILGLTTGASNNGDVATILPAGEIAEPSWNLNPGLPVYLGNTGLLTQTLPTTGAILQIGVALSATRLLVDFKIPIILGG